MTVAKANSVERKLRDSRTRYGLVMCWSNDADFDTGINAPTRTSVFIGDSAFLTALMVSNHHEPHAVPHLHCSTDNAPDEPDGEVTISLVRWCFMALALTEYGGSYCRDFLRLLVNSP
jgi:hypothetical protein